jgi:hypothetical protein
MFNPFSRTRTLGFNVRPQDDLPGFRLDPEAEVPGFNIDENGLPRPRRFLDSGSSVQPTLPQATADPSVLAWLRRSLALPQPLTWTPPGLRWPPAGGLAVGPTETTATMPEPDQPDAAFQGSDPDATNSAAAAPRDDGELYPQAGVSSPWAPSTGVPALPTVLPSADPNFVLANAEDDVREAQQTRPPIRSTPPLGPPVPPLQTAPATGRRQMPPLKNEMSGEALTQLEERRREEALNEVQYKIRRAERAPYWDHVLRQLPVPTPPGSKVQAPLPYDWREAVRKINSAYLDYTEVAARKHGIPAELLARLLFRESSYRNEGVDKNGNRLGDKPVGIPQMYPSALRDVGMDPRNFGRAGAAAQIDAGAAYLARQYRRFGDWPRAVAAYNFGAGNIESWLAGKAPTYDNITQRSEEESAAFRGRTGKPNDKETVEDREKKSEERAREQLGQWAQLQAYLPYIFLGDPARYDNPRMP